MNREPTRWYGESTVYPAICIQYTGRYIICLKIKEEE